MMHALDWAIVAIVGAFLLFQVIYSRRYARSAVDFLAANRLAGRYLLITSGSVASTAAISVIAIFQYTYQVGFGANWWGMLSVPITFLLTITAFVSYRYRETRVMTMAQLYELRYSRGFRIASGLIAYLAGIINMGIFPAVAARFFMQFCGIREWYLLTDTWTVEMGTIGGAGITGIASMGDGGLSIPLVYTGMMLLLVGLALVFTLASGQITVLLTDYMQGFFGNMVLMTLLVFLLFKFTLVQDKFLKSE